MRFRPSPLKLISIFLCGLLFISNSVLAYSAETNLWKERRKSFEVASLPMPLPVSSSRVLSSPKFSIGDPGFKQSFKNPVYRLDSRLRGNDGLALIQQYGTIRKISSANSGRVLIHIQDVHLNPEAQANIGKAIEAMAEAGQVDLVALEGAFAPVNLERFRKFSDREVVTKVADYLLREKKISGPIHTAFTSEAQKFPTYVGIDDKTHYDANVAAYLESSQLANSARKDLEQMSQQLEDQKKELFNPELKSLDARIQSFRKGALSFGDFVKSLPVDRPLAVESFLSAYEMEQTLNFSLVEVERTRLLKDLANKLSVQQLDSLSQATIAYRAGELRHTDFYVYLKTLCEHHGLPLKHYPAMNSYLQYVLLSDSIDADQLLKDVKKMEEAAVSSVVQTKDEQTLVDQDTQIYLAGKLVDFSLTKEEWAEYSSSPNVSIGDPVSLNPFEDFYREAELRDQLMAQNILKAIKNSQAKVTVLVTGGFHTAGIEGVLSPKSVVRSDGLAPTDYGLRTTYVSFVPKITKVDDVNGSSYLSVFAQEKTPLDQLFAGEKLFLNPTGIPPAATTAAMVALEQEAADPKNQIGDKAQQTIAALTGESVPTSVRTEDISDGSKFISLKWTGTLKHGPQNSIEKISFEKTHNLFSFGNLSRRNFLRKTGAASAALAFLGELLVQSAEQFRPSAVRPTEKDLEKGFKYPINNFLNLWPIRLDRAYIGIREGNIKVVPDPINKDENVLQVRYPQGSVDPHWANIGKGPLGGVDFYVETPKAQELYFSYEVMFQEGFDFVKTGKLPGLFAGEEASGTKRKNGASFRGLWRKLGKGAIYVYRTQDHLPEAARSKYGEMFESEGKWVFKPGQWHKFEQRIKLNDIGQENGEIEIWFEGQLVYKKTGLILRTDANLLIDQWAFSTFFGGDDGTFAATREEFIYFKNIVVSKNRITAPKKSASSEKTVSPVVFQTPSSIGYLLRLLLFKSYPGTMAKYFWGLYAAFWEWNLIMYYESIVFKYAATIPHANNLYCYLVIYLSLAAFYGLHILLVRQIAKRRVDIDPSTSYFWDGVIFSLYALGSPYLYNNWIAHLLLITHLSIDAVRLWPHFVDSRFTNLVETKLKPLHSTNGRTSTLLLLGSVFGSVFAKYSFKLDALSFTLFLTLSFSLCAVFLSALAMPFLTKTFPRVHWQSNDPLVFLRRFAITMVYPLVVVLLQQLLVKADIFKNPSVYLEIFTLIVIIIWFIFGSGGDSSGGESSTPPDPSPGSGISKRINTPLGFPTNNFSFNRSFLNAIPLMVSFLAVFGLSVQNSFSQTVNTTAPPQGPPTKTNQLSTPSFKEAGRLTFSSPEDVPQNIAQILASNFHWTENLILNNDSQLFQDITKIRETYDIKFTMGIPSDPEASVQYFFPQSTNGHPTLLVVIKPTYFKTPTDMLRILPGVIYELQAIYTQKLTGENKTIYVDQKHKEFYEKILKTPLPPEINKKIIKEEIKILEELLKKNNKPLAMSDTPGAQLPLLKNLRIQEEFDLSPKIFRELIPLFDKRANQSFSELRSHVSTLDEIRRLPTSDWKKAVIDSLTFVILQGQAHWAFKNSMINKFNNSKNAERGVRMVLSEKGELGGAHSAYYPPHPGTDNMATLVMDGNTFSGINQFREILSSKNTARVKNRLPENFMDRNKGSWVDAMAALFFAEKLWAHEFIHNPTTPLLNLIRNAELIVLKFERLFHEATKKHLGAKTVEFLFNLVKKETGGKEALKAFLAPNRYKHIQTQLPANDDRFIEKIYTDAQPDGALAMAERRTTGRLNSFSQLINRIDPEGRWISAVLQQRYFLRPTLIFGITGFAVSVAYQWMYTEPNISSNPVANVAAFILMVFISIPLMFALNKDSGFVASHEPYFQNKVGMFIHDLNERKIALKNYLEHTDNKETKFLTFTLVGLGLSFIGAVGYCLSHPVSNYIFGNLMTPVLIAVGGANISGSLSHLWNNAFYSKAWYYEPLNAYLWANVPWVMKKSGWKIKTKLPQLNLWEAKIYFETPHQQILANHIINRGPLTLKDIRNLGGFENIGADQLATMAADMGHYVRQFLPKLYMNPDLKIFYSDLLFIQNNFTRPPPSDELLALALDVNSQKKIKITYILNRLEGMPLQVGVNRFLPDSLNYTLDQYEQAMTDRKTPDIMANQFRRVKDKKKLNFDKVKIGFVLLAEQNVDLVVPVYDEKSVQDARKVFQHRRGRMTTLLVTPEFQKKHSRALRWADSKFIRIKIVDANLMDENKLILKRLENNLPPELVTNISNIVLVKTRTLKIDKSGTEKDENLRKIRIKTADEIFNGAQIISNEVQRGIDAIIRAMQNA